MRTCGKLTHAMGCVCDLNEGKTAMERIKEIQEDVENKRVYMWDTGTVEYLLRAFKVMREIAVERIKVSDLSEGKCFLDVDKAFEKRMEAGE